MLVPCTDPGIFPSFLSFSHLCIFIGQKVDTNILPANNVIAPCPLRAPLVVIIVGPPCRGKSLAAHKIARHLCWKGECAKGTQILQIDWNWKRRKFQFLYSIILHGNPAVYTWLRYNVPNLISIQLFWLSFHFSFPGRQQCRIGDILGHIVLVPAKQQRCRKYPHYTHTHDALE